MNDFKNWKTILYDWLFSSCGLGFRSRCKERQKVPAVLELPSFTFWVTSIVCIWPCFLVRRARYIWIAHGAISWWRTNRVDDSHVCSPSPTPSCVPATLETHLFFHSLIKSCLVVSRSWFMLFPQPFYLSSDSTKFYYLSSDYSSSTALSSGGPSSLRPSWNLLTPTHPLFTLFLPCTNTLDLSIITFFKMIHIHPHLPRDPKLLRPVTLS